MDFKEANDENSQEKDSSSLININMSSKNSNIRVIKEIGANRNENMPIKKDSPKIDYNPIFTSNIKGNNNFFII